MLESPQEEIRSLPASSAQHDSAEKGKWMRETLLELSIAVCSADAVSQLGRAEKRKRTHAQGMHCSQLLF
jgi:hypothetical protein